MKHQYASPIFNKWQQECLHRAGLIMKLSKLEIHNILMLEYRAKQHCIADLKISSYIFLD